MAISINQQVFLSFADIDNQNVTVASTASGSLIAVSITFAAGGGGAIDTVTDNQGNTYIAALGAVVRNGGLGTDIWYCQNATGGVTTVNVAFTLHNDGGSIVVTEAAGVSTTAAFDSATNIDASGTATTAIIPVITTSKNGELLVACANPNDVIFLGADSPWTAVADATFGGVHAYEVQTSAGASSGDWVPSASQHFVSSSAAFFPAASAPAAKVASTILVF